MEKLAIDCMVYPENHLHLEEQQHGVLCSLHKDPEDGLYDEHVAMFANSSIPALMTALRGKPGALKSGLVLDKVDGHRALSCQCYYDDDDRETATLVVSRNAWVMLSEASAREVISFLERVHYGPAHFEAPARFGL